MELIVILTVLLIVVGTPVTLLWWRLANKWARREHEPGYSAGQVISDASRARAADPVTGGRSRKGEAPTVIRVAEPDAIEQGWPEADGPEADPGRDRV